MDPLTHAVRSKMRALSLLKFVTLVAESKDEVFYYCCPYESMIQDLFIELKSLIPKKYIKRASPAKASFFLTNGSKIFIKNAGYE